MIEAIAAHLDAPPNSSFCGDAGAGTHALDREPRCRRGGHSHQLQQRCSVGDVRRRCIMAGCQDWAAKRSDKLAWCLTSVPCASWSRDAGCAVTHGRAGQGRYRLGRGALQARLARRARPGVLPAPCRWRPLPATRRLQAAPMRWALLWPVAAGMQAAR